MIKKTLSFLLLIVCITVLFSSAIFIYKDKVNIARAATIGQAFLENLDIKEDDSAIIPCDLSITYKRKKLNVKLLTKYNRVYVDCKAYLDGINRKYTFNDNQIDLGNALLDLDNKTLFKSDEKISFRGDVINLDGNIYLSLIDLNEALGYYSRFSYSNKSIYILNGKKLSKDAEEIKKRYDIFSKAAYIRLEDFTAGSTYTKADEFEKIRVVAELLHNEEQEFHVAWIPRYVNPEKGIDNDLLEDTSYSNIDFLYTLDFMINKGAVVGLHGYTHQYGNEESIIGSELGDERFKTDEDVRKRAQSAIITAKTLNIPYTFWESPHYRVTSSQQLILEEYFDYIYEPSHKAYNTDVYIGANGITKYIPTPLSYVKDKDVDGMIEAMNSKDKNEALSFFYHVAKEAEYINIADNDETLDATYSDKSILKKLIKHASDLGYSFKSINGQ